MLCNLNSCHIIGNIPVLIFGILNCNDDKLRNICIHVKNIKKKLIGLIFDMPTNPDKAKSINIYIKFIKHIIPHILCILYLSSCVTNFVILF